MVIHQKHKKSLEEITNDLCPVLSVQQLYRISTMYWDDRYNTETVSHEVLGRMKQLMVDNNTAASHSFLLDDDSSIPFSLDDIASLMEDKVRATQIPRPTSLLLQLCEPNTNGPTARSILRLDSPFKESSHHIECVRWLRTMPGQNLA